MVDESIADEFIRVMAEIRELAEFCANEHEERHAIRALKQAANNAITAGLRTAQDSLAVAREVRRLTEEMKASKASHRSA